MNYKIEAIDILLHEDCILQRYYPLIPYKNNLIDNLLKNHCFTKEECLKLTDERLLKLGLASAELVKLFRCFLIMYDIKENKLKEFNDIATSEEEKKVFRELYLLPGVKGIRAKLYYEANYKSLTKIASTSFEQIISDTTTVIINKGLNMKAPLPKEVKTHIAVAKALTIYAV